MSVAKLERSTSPTCRADADAGNTRSSEKPQFAPRNGAPSTRSNATTAAPIGIGRRITAFVERYKKLSSIGRGPGSGRPSSRRISRRTLSESSRSPSSTITAGVIITAATAANATTATPA